MRVQVAPQEDEFLLDILWLHECLEVGEEIKLGQGEQKFSSASLTIDAMQ